MLCFKLFHCFLGRFWWKKYTLLEILIYVSRNFMQCSSSCPIWCFNMCPFFHQESAFTYFDRISIATIDYRYFQYSAVLSIAESMKMKALKIVLRTNSRFLVFLTGLKNTSFYWALIDLLRPVIWSLLVLWRWCLIW